MITVMGSCGSHALRRVGFCVPQAEHQASARLCVPQPVLVALLLGGLHREAFQDYLFHTTPTSWSEICSQALHRIPKFVQNAMHCWIHALMQ
jgi:hypothetical protein